MLDLLNQYSLSEIIIFLIFFAIAIKECVNFFDWCKKRLGAVYNKENNRQIENKELHDAIENNMKMIDNLIKQQNKVLLDIESLNKSITMLIESDKDDIKAWITEKHHYYCYNLKYIDDYNLECIEKRYHHYVDEGGNSFIANLMAELRQLPKVSSVQ